MDQVILTYSSAVEIYRDEDESEEIIVHEPLLENLSMDVSESECNIVNKTLSQNNSSDVTTNVITELK